MSQPTIISTSELFEMFPSAESARDYFEAQRWPDGPVCPACGERERIWRDARRPGFYRCNADLLVFTVRTGTIFERSKVLLHKWAVALETARMGISSPQLAEAIGVTQKTAWFMLHRIREACGNDPTELAGIDAITARVFAWRPANKGRAVDTASARAGEARKGQMAPIRARSRTMRRASR
jgi:transposase-like protein